MTQGNVQPLPIALPDFLGGGRRRRAGAQRHRHHRQQPETLGPVRADRSGGLHRKNHRCGQRRRAFPTGARSMRRRWSPAGCCARATAGMRAEFRLWDVFAGQQQAGQQYDTAAENWRRIGHIISDAIYERLTGEKGYFDTRIVFVDETGPKDRRVKRLDHHGPGRRQCALSHARRRTRADAALLAFDAGDHLYGVRPGRSARLSAQHRNQPARDRRQFPRHDASRRVSRPTGSA